MLDHFSIFTRGGIVLWSRSFTPSAEVNNPVNALVRHALIEEKGADGRLDTEGYAIRWTFANELELIFVAVYQRILQLTYIPDLLASVKELFINLFQPFLTTLLASSSGKLLPHSSAGGAKDGVRVMFSKGEFAQALKSWEGLFDDLLRKLEVASAQIKKRGKRPVDGVNVSAGQPPYAVSLPTPDLPAAPTSSSSDAAEIARNVEALKSRLKAGGGPGGRRGKGGKGAASDASRPGSGHGSSGLDGGGKRKAVKEMRKWDDSKVTTADMASLDFSTGAGSSNVSTPEVEKEARDLEGLVDKRSYGTRSGNGLYEVADIEDGGDGDDDDDDGDTASTAQGGFLSRLNGASSSKATPAKSSSGIGAFLSRIMGSATTLTAADLEPALAAMEEHLMRKNVAKDIAEKICDSVAKGLVGREVSGYGATKREVRAALEKSITRILTPRTSTDILLEIDRKRRSSANKSALGATADPYTIAFVGVNGVGKSTNLSKVCFWLLQNGHRVLIAACDTFRSGAVEQLRVHVRNLGQLEREMGMKGGEGQRIELYERGYGKDAAGICKDAVAYGKSKGFDVVLIDTAGRMQDNEPLMRALAKLVSVNSPDKIIFVGEALVGNEAVDQLSKFDKALRDFSGVSKPRGIDGMLLTKWDTIDDKVGAALSMTYTTGQPIYFVGVGQTYTDLRALKVSHVVNALLRD